MDFIVISIIFLALLAIARGAVGFAPWVPIPYRDLKRVAAMANLKPDEVFYDLGSGDGRLILRLAKENPEVKFIGVEIAWPLWFLAQIKKFFLGRSNVKFLLKNLLRTEIKDADVVYFFGMPHSLGAKFRELLEKQLKSGTRVISFVFPIKGWRPKAVDAGESNRAKIYVYEMGEHSE